MPGLAGVGAQLLGESMGRIARRHMDGGTSGSKPMVHSMGAFNNAVLTSVVPSDVVSRMRTIFIRVPGSCEGCIAARKWYMDEGVHVERINYKSCRFCESSD